MLYFPFSLTDDSCGYRFHTWFTQAVLEVLLFEMKNNLIKMHPVIVAGNPTKSVDLHLASGS
jgi:hypothetical protein